MINAFHEVSALEFHTYLEDIRNRLKKEAPEWEINLQNMADPNHRTFYHLNRFDYSKGKDQTWGIDLREFIFAYEETIDGKTTCHLLNHHPIGDKL